MIPRESAINNDTKEFGMCYFWKDIIMDFQIICVS